MIFCVLFQAAETDPEKYKEKDCPKVSKKLVEGLSASIAKITGRGTKFAGSPMGVGVGAFEGGLQAVVNIFKELSKGSKNGNMLHTLLKGGTAGLRGFRTAFRDGFINTHDQFQ